MSRAGCQCMFHDLGRSVAIGQVNSELRLNHVVNIDHAGYSNGAVMA